MTGLSSRGLTDRVRGMAREERQVVAVAGSKGGVGASVTAALLAAVAAEHGHGTLLVEASGAAGPMHVLLGLSTADSESAHDATTALVPNLELARIPVRGVGAAERRLRFRRVMNAADDVPRVVIDAGSRVDDVLAACGVATRAIVVTQRDRVSLAAAYALCKALWFALPALDLGLVVNGATPEQAEVAAEIVRSAAVHFIGREVPLTGVLPHDADFASRVESGASLDALRQTELGHAAQHVAHAAFAAATEARSSTQLRIRNG